MLFKGEVLSEPKIANKTTFGVAPMSIFYGDAATRAAVLAEVGKDVAIGSLYVSSVSAALGHFYIKTQNAGASTDWVKVTASAAD